MGKQANFQEEVNGYKIYKLNQTVGGLNTYTISKDGIVVMSKPTLVEARNWANAN